MEPVIVTAGVLGLAGLVAWLISRLSSLTSALEERRARDEEAFRSLSRLERVMAGSRSRGMGGENLLFDALEGLPSPMIVRDFAINGRVCELAIRMSDGKFLPIDSKWPAANLMEQWKRDVSSGEELTKRIDSEVCRKVKEVASYVDPVLTLPLAILALPDSVWSYCRRAHDFAHRSRVVIVSYSTVLPVVLGLWNMHRAYARNYEVDRIVLGAHELSVSLDEVTNKLEGQLSRGLTMAGNAVLEMRAAVARAKAAVSSVQSGERATV